MCSSKAVDFLGINPFSSHFFSLTHGSLANPAGYLWKALTPKFPDPPKPPPPPPGAPALSTLKLQPPTGLLESQTKAARAGTGQLVIPQDSLSVPL